MRHQRCFILYLDHLTKFCVLRPLTSKRAAEVAYELIDIFLLLGAPHILQSDNGSEFPDSIITELKGMWPELLVVHGKPRHPQSQGSVERLNLKNMLIAWINDNYTTDWSVALRLVGCSLVKIQVHILASSRRHIVHYLDAILTLGFDQLPCPKKYFNV